MSELFEEHPLSAFTKKKVRKKHSSREDAIQMMVCKYLHQNYPEAIWMCDLSSGMRLPIHIAARNKKMRSSRGLPDLFIAAPGFIGSRLVSESKYHGLFIELKKEDQRNANGTIKKSDHHKEQQDILNRLTDLGYKAVFACGLEEAKKIIDEYLKK